MFSFEVQVKRNPHVMAARKLGKRVIEDRRHVKRSRAERKRDALDQERNTIEKE